MKKSSFILLSLVIPFFLIFPGCTESEEDPLSVPVTVPVVITGAIDSVTSGSAIFSGMVKSDGGSPVIRKGFCFSLKINPETSDSTTNDGTGTGFWSRKIEHLLPDTIYFIRAYATNGKGTGYGAEQSFRTLKMPVEEIADVDGNRYPVIVIGHQKWLGSNLRVTKFRNGESIPNITDPNQWKILTTGAWCAYENRSENIALYGNLYNWYAVADERGLCPDGWHVASDADWNALAYELGGGDVAGGKLKSTGTIEQGNGLWFTPNTGATNSSRFSGLPGGYRINYGNFYSAGNVAYLWTSSDTTMQNAWNYILDANNAELNRHYNLFGNGFSVRCCKD